jgi:hypothetical protein
MRNGRVAANLRPSDLPYQQLLAISGAHQRGGLPQPNPLVIAKRAQLRFLVDHARKCFEQRVQNASTLLLLEQSFGIARCRELIN